MPTPRCSWSSSPIAKVEAAMTMSRSAVVARRIQPMAVARSMVREARAEGEPVRGDRPARASKGRPEHTVVCRPLEELPHSWPPKGGGTRLKVRFHEDAVRTGWIRCEHGPNIDVCLWLLCLLGAGRSRGLVLLPPGPPLTSSEPRPSAGFCVRQRRSCSSVMAASTSRWGEWTSYARRRHQPDAGGASAQPHGRVVRVRTGLIVLCWPMRGVLLFVFAWSSRPRLPAAGR